MSSGGAYDDTYREESLRRLQGLANSSDGDYYGSVGGASALTPLPQVPVGTSMLNAGMSTGDVAMTRSAGPVVTGATSAYGPMRPISSGINDFDQPYYIWNAEGTRTDAIAPQGYESWVAQLPSAGNLPSPYGLQPNDGGIDWGSALGGGFSFPQSPVPDRPTMSYAEQMSNVGRAVRVGAVGAAEMVIGGAYNYAVRVAGGAASVPYAALFGVDAAVGVQEGFKERFGYEMRSEGARAFGQAMQPVGQWAQSNVINPVRAYSESVIGDGATTILAGVAQAGLEIAGVVTGGRAAQAFLDDVAFVRGVGGAPGAYSPSGMAALTQVRVYSVNAIRENIISALPEGASLVQTTRGGAAIVRFGDDAFYNIPMQSNAAAYSKLFTEVRTADTMGGVFTDAAQTVRNGYSFGGLSQSWRDRINSLPPGLSYLADKWESAARGSYVHDGVRQMVERGTIPGSQNYLYKTVGPDLVPKSGTGLKYEITQQTSSLNAIIAHSRRYPNELMRYVTYK